MADTNYSISNSIAALTRDPSAGWKQSRVPPKKRGPQLYKQMNSKKRQRVVLRDQRSSPLELKHHHKNYGHVQRVKFALFLKIMMQHLSSTDEIMHSKAKEVSEYAVNWTGFVLFLSHKDLTHLHCYYTALAN